MSIPSLEDSFELLTKKEWDDCLNNCFLKNLEISPELLGIKIGNDYFYRENPRLPETIDNHNDTVYYLKLTYGICKHYFDKGIPDDTYLARIMR